MIGLGLSATLGHIYPIWAQFKGGKGVATLFGMVLAIQPVVAVSCVGVFVLVLYLTRYVSLSSILAGVALPICVLWIYNEKEVFSRGFAVASHGQERISQAMLAQGLGVAGGAVFGNTQAGNIFNNIYGPAATLGVLLPNSRNQELEADHYGLIFAAMAGYNPQEAIPFWTRMANMSNSGAKPPPFLSTHPADQDRIAELERFMPEALKYYKPMYRK